LVVEDDIFIRTDMAELLTAEGYRVLQAANADEAVRVLENCPQVAMVFTDVHMPGSMDGLRLAQYVADRWPPIRLLVTSAETVAAENTLPAGARFCPKPCPPRSLTSTVAELLSQQTLH
jgi:CheY-like chemotaxis protein